MITTKSAEGIFNKLENMTKILYMTVSNDVTF